ncbi:TetR/AcrR family transcriptional regulator [soil metagenome]
MTERTRAYRSPRRAEQAAATRHVVLAAAHDLFTQQGYAATTVADIAGRAQVAVDTVYAAVGRKPVVMRAVLESAISGTDDAVPAAQRAYVAEVRDSVTAAEKLRRYATAIAEMQPRLAPIVIALREAAVADTECAELWEEISDRRARNMRLLAADLRSTGELRRDRSDDDVADVIWSMNSPEFWTLMVIERGWSPDRFEGWLADAWIRLLLEHPSR